MEYLFIAFGIIFGTVAVFLIVFSLIKSKGFLKPINERIGEYGEKHVAKILSSVPNSIVFNDIILFDKKTRRSSQIDHVVIRENGVFVIETKNYAGSIFGSDEQREWTQVLADGEIKNSLYNPIKQNATHIYFLAKALSLSNIYISVIVFPRAELHIQTSAFVCNDTNSLYQVLNANTNIKLSDNQMQNIKTQLFEIKASSTITKEQHIQNVINIQNDIANNICPRCGKTLVIRNGKNRQFYRCIRFPHCKFTKDK